MKISELQERLEEIKEEHGDLEFEEAEIQKVNIGIEGGKGTCFTFKASENRVFVQNY